MWTLLHMNKSVLLYVDIMPWQTIMYVNSLWLFRERSIFIGGALQQGGGNYSGEMILVGGGGGSFFW